MLIQATCAWTSCQTLPCPPKSSSALCSHHSRIWSEKWLRRCQDCEPKILPNPHLVHPWSSCCCRDSSYQANFEEFAPYLGTSFYPTQILCLKLARCIVPRKSVAKVSKNKKPIGEKGIGLNDKAIQQETARWIEPDWLTDSLTDWLANWLLLLLATVAYKFWRPLPETSAPFNEPVFRLSSQSTNVGETKHFARVVPVTQMLISLSLWHLCAGLAAGDSPFCVEVWLRAVHYTD